MSELIPADAASFCRLLSLSVFWLLFVAVPSHSVGQPVDLLAGTKEIDEALHKLDQTPVGKQVAEIERKFSAATEQVGKARDEVQAPAADRGIHGVPEAASGTRGQA